MKISVPPIKCQGIKTKLVDWIVQTIAWDKNGVWIEPFCGSGVVGFNVRPNEAIFSDINPHIINFYENINSKNITASLVREFLEFEGNNLQEKGVDYYYEIRSRFNKSHSSLDFLFLNRACFNGLIRFNKKGNFNVPFNNKENRFSKSYITKIVNQVKYLQNLFSQNSYKFMNSDFRNILYSANENDFIYSDPPYIGRHVDYYDTWQEKDEFDLFNILNSTKSKFILSTWHHNKFRTNQYIEPLWLSNGFHIYIKEHFYHVGAKEINRNAMFEALVTNYLSEGILPKSREDKLIQLELNICDVNNLKILNAYSEDRIHFV